jgi:Ca-activated chloride channel homolog
MRWASPENLWLLTLLPVMVLYIMWFREGDIPGFRFSSIKKLSGLGVPRSMKLHVMIPGLLRVLAMGFLIVALARPQKGLRSEEMTTKATDILICLDASRSMLSVDFKPQNRFEVAKNVISEFIKGREYDRIGMVVFAEQAITQCPLTLDRSALLTLIELAQIGMIPADQTAIGLGLTASINRLKNSSAKSKIIILVTDGANNAGSIDPITAGKTAAAFKIKIYSIGAGSPEGGLMPVTDAFGNQHLQKFDNDLDEDLLLKVASETNGKYFRAKSPEALKTIFNEIDSLEKTDIKIKEYVDYQELYIWFLVAALILLLLELGLNKTVFRTLP